jgi:lysozyme
MQTGPDGIGLMHYYEQCRLTAYPDPATGGDPWTIGWGDTGPDVVPGLQITQEEADERFANRLAMEFEPGVSGSLKRTPTQKQYDGLVAFSFNVGLGNFKSSTLLKKFNAGQLAECADQFRVWTRANNKVMKGLQRRREAERSVFLGENYAKAIQAALARFP